MSDASLPDGPTLEQRNLEIAACRRAGASLRELGEAFGLSRERVRQILRRVAPNFEPSDAVRIYHGRCAPRPEHGMLAALELYADPEMPVRAIAKTTGLPVSQIYTAARRAGLHRNAKRWTRERLREQLLALADRLGRSPRSRDAAEHIGGGFLNAVVQVYGSLGQLQEDLGLPATDKGCRKRSRRGETIRRVAEILRRRPKATWSQIGRDLGISPQGARRAGLIVLDKLTSRPA